MSFLLVICASAFASIVNLMTKRNLDITGSSRGYLVVYFFFSFISSFFLSPEIFKAEVNSSMLLIGGVTGALIFLSMIMLSSALMHGPAGVTFAFENASSILPSILLFIVFGSEFHFIMSPFLILGFICVVVGMFWSAQPDLFSSRRGVEKALYRIKKFVKDLAIQQTQMHSIKKWACYAIAAFFLQGVILSIFHWRTLLLLNTPIAHPLIFKQFTQEEAAWFMPGLFTITTVLNAKFFWIKDRRWFNLSEILHGMVAGLLNGGTTFLLLLATHYASPAHKGIIFPLFAVSVIAFCGIWGQKLYQERINWMAIGLCILGVLLGSC